MFSAWLHWEGTRDSHGVNCMHSVEFGCCSRYVLGNLVGSLSISPVFSACAVKYSAERARGSQGSCSRFISGLFIRTDLFQSFKVCNPSCLMWLLWASCIWNNLLPKTKPRLAFLTIALRPASAKHMKLVSTGQPRFHLQQLFYLQGRGQGAQSGWQPPAPRGARTEGGHQKCTPWCMCEVAHLQLPLQKGNRRDLSPLHGTYAHEREVFILLPDKISSGPAAAIRSILRAGHQRGIFPAWLIQVHHSEMTSIAHLWDNAFYFSFTNDFRKVIAWMCNLGQKNFSDTRQKTNDWTGNIFEPPSKPLSPFAKAVLCYLLLCCNKGTNEVKRRGVYMNQCANIGATLFTYCLVQFICILFMLEWFAPVFQHRWGWINSIRATVGSS